MGTILWGLWNHRNAAIWRNKSLHPAQRVQSSLIDLHEWLEANVSTKALTGPGHTTGGARWEKPPTGIRKCKVDAAISQENEAVGLGLILQDENGSVAKNYSGWCLPNEAEAMALREAATWLCQLRVTDGVIESYSLQVL